MKENKRPVGRPKSVIGPVTRVGVGLYKEHLDKLTVIENNLPEDSGGSVSAALRFAIDHAYTFVLEQKKLDKEKRYSWEYFLGFTPEEKILELNETIKVRQQYASTMTPYEAGVFDRRIKNMKEEIAKFQHEVI